MAAAPEVKTFSLVEKYQSLPFSFFAQLAAQDRDGSPTLGFV
jgi:hypothetical protein